MRIAVLDTETTGLKPKKHAMIQLAILIVEDGKIIGSNAWRVRPHEGAQIDEKALEVNGINASDLAFYPEASEVLPLIEEWLGSWINPEDENDKLTMAAFNVSFDNGFLREFMKINGSDASKYFHRRTLDVMSLAIAYLISNGITPKKNKFSQINCAKAIGIPMDESKAHEAFYDTSICWLILDKVSKLLNESTNRENT